MIGSPTRLVYICPTLHLVDSFVPVLCYYLNSYRSPCSTNVAMYYHTRTGLSIRNFSPACISIFIVSSINSPEPTRLPSPLIARTMRLVDRVKWPRVHILVQLLSRPFHLYWVVELDSLSSFLTLQSLPDPLVLYQCHCDHHHIQLHLLR